jgi:hypothetical protein
MMGTPPMTVRVPTELLSAAKTAHPELANETDSVLIRAGLAMLAGIAISKVIGELRGKGQTNRVPIPGQSNIDAAA